MARNDKQFDAVRLMRSIRDRISREIDGMTFEEEQAYIRNCLGDEIVARFCTANKQSNNFGKNKDRCAGDSIGTEGITPSTANQAP
ncbi:MAG: hypothetical protein OXE51_10885 [Gammaproteobacteria bacterium]|nr:hypothetical protein [Gammaproteobacteria bacterium]